ncbi:hypothetical protein ACEUZ9_002688 [Paracoccus litorisediminis]|uniref:hypothetical protein n=1 Tax=Paracoccus litorisediminis TaxID=2006130 RepID=UPI0037329DB7
MLHRTITGPIVQAGGAQVSLTRYLAGRAAKTALHQISQSAKGLADLDPGNVLDALREMHATAREARDLIRACATAAKELVTTADALTKGEAHGPSTMATVGLEVFASVDFLRAVDPSIDMPEPAEVADHLRTVAGQIAEDVAKARERVQLASDLLAETVDLALTFAGADPNAILAEFRPTPRLRQELDLKAAVLPETVQAVARQALAAKRREKRDRRLAQQSANRREIALVVSDAWKGAGK